MNKQKAVLEDYSLSAFMALKNNLLITTNYWL